MSERIKLEMNTMDVLCVMSEGNPGALTCLLEILKRGEEIDPDGALGGLGAILMLDTLKIYGSRIYMLWNDVCHRDVVKVLAIERAWQLGQLVGTTEMAINRAIDNRGDGLDLNGVMEAVKKRLPNFNCGNSIPNPFENLGD